VRLFGPERQQRALACEQALAKIAYDFDIPQEIIAMIRSRVYVGAQSRGFVPVKTKDESSAAGGGGFGANGKAPRSTPKRSRRSASGGASGTCTYSPFFTNTSVDKKEPGCKGYFYPLEETDLGALTMR
jgi:hypothetical protein